MKLFLTSRILLTLGKDKYIDHKISKLKTSSNLTNINEIEYKEDIVKEDMLRLANSVHFFYGDKSYKHLKDQVKADLKKLQVDLKDLKQCLKKSR